MDGTFFAVKKIEEFTQLYIISIKEELDANRPLVLPMVFILMKSRTQDAYQNAFKALKQLSEDFGAIFNPSDISIDFEYSVINAPKLNFRKFRYNCAVIIIFSRCSDDK